MNGPTPTMLDMLRAVACIRPNPRVRCGGAVSGVGWSMFSPARRVAAARILCQRSF